MASPVWLGSLPPEVAEIIIQCARPTDLCSIRLTCKVGRDLVDLFWKPHTGIAAREHPLFIPINGFCGKRAKLALQQGLKEELLFGTSNDGFDDEIGCHADRNEHLIGVAPRGGYRFTNLLINLEDKGNLNSFYYRGLGRKLDGIEGLSGLKLVNAEADSLRGLFGELKRASMTLKDIKLDSLDGGWHNQPERHFLRSDAMDNLTALTKLHIKAFDLGPNSIPFAKLQQLRKVKLVACNMPNLPPGVWQLPHLKVLHISCMELGTITDDIPVDHGLETLMIWEARITSLPSSMSNLVQLTNLELLGLALTTVPSWLTVMTNLRELKIQNCEALVGSYPALESLTALRDLCLTGNSIDAGVESHARLKNLQTLSVSVGTPAIVDLAQASNTLTSLTFRPSMPLETLPATVMSATRLRTLDIMCFNALKAIPDAISRLVYLTSLSITDCSNLVLPDAISALSRLCTLQLTAVNSLPEAVGQLASLRILFVDFGPYQLNPYPANPAGLPTSLTNLSRLSDLSISCDTVAGTIPQLRNMPELQSVSVRVSGHNRDEPDKQFWSAYKDSMSITKLDLAMSQNGDNVGLFGCFLETLPNLRELSITHGFSVPLVQPFSALTKLTRLHYRAPDVEGHQTIVFAPPNLEHLTVDVHPGQEPPEGFAVRDIPAAAVTRLTNLRYVKLPSNWDICPELAQLPRLETIDFFEDHFTINQQD